MTDLNFLIQEATKYLESTRTTLIGLIVLFWSLYSAGKVLLYDDYSSLKRDSIGMFAVVCLAYLAPMIVTKLGGILSSPVRL